MIMIILHDDDNDIRITESAFIVSVNSLEKLCK